MKKRKPRPVSYRDVSLISMAAKDDRGKPGKTMVIDEGRIKRYVGIGWVDEGPAEKADYFKYPEVK